jgi:hypothetical protein
MTFLTFLNELSYPTGHLSQGEAKLAARTLIAVLKELKGERADLALHSSEPLPHVPLGDGLWLSSLRADGETLDDWRFLRGLENRAPFNVGLEYGEDGLVDYEVNDRRSVGLGLAHNFDALALSFDREPWRRTLIEIDRIELNEDGIFEYEVVTARNASISGHVDLLRTWVRAVRPEGPTDGDDMWESRAERFPRLRFLPQVEPQLRSLKPGTPELFAISNRLWEIQIAATEWNVAVEPLPQFRSKATPEHEQRRTLFEYTDFDGEIRCFDLHVRYTPGAGRIHMFCNRASATVSIGYVGSKVQ